MDIEPRMVTDPGTGRRCKCSHGSDLHDLIDIQLQPSDDVDCDTRIGWRFACRGVFVAATAMMDPRAAMRCSCNNLEVADV